MKDYGISREYQKITKGIKKKKQKNLDRLLSKKTISKRILRSQRAVLEIKKNKPEPYRSIYFKEQYLKEKKNLFSK